MLKRIGAIIMALILGGIFLGNPQMVWAMEDETTYKASYQGASFNYKIVDGTAKIVNAWINSDYASINFPIEVDGIPVTVIGSGVLNGCHQNIISVTLPEGITSIEDSAFKGRGSLYSINIPKSVVSIGDSAFENCSYLSNVIIEDLSAFSKIAFGDNYANPLHHGADLRLNGELVSNLTLSQDIEYINKGVFQGCKSLTSVTIPAHIRSIGDSAFQNCAKLTKVIIEEGVEEIGASAFENCSNLTSVIIPDSVIKIGESAFAECDGLQSVELSQNITCIEERMFAGCSNLRNVSMPKGIQTIGDYSFSYCTSLKGITIPESVTSIGTSAFQCSGLTSVEVPHNVTSISDKAFWGCDYLASVTMAEGITSIGDYAFRECYELKRIVLPMSVEHIGIRAFKSCSGLTSVLIPKSVTNIGELAFEGCDDIIIYGWVGSCAQTYAIENEILFEPIRYSVSYDANGGTNAPDSQEKVAGLDLELTNVLPKREGYAFLGWSTSQNGAVTYSPGAIYDADGDNKLYAVWKEGYKAVYYNANGGINAPDSQVIDKTAALILNHAIPTREGYHFSGWSTSANGEVTYASGATCKEETDIVLYAQWEPERKTVCGNCDGKGITQANCSACSGKGRFVLDYVKCNKCDGIGAVTKEKEVTATCAICHGSGRSWSDSLNGYVTCQGCSGTGEYTYTTETQVNCQECIGSGEQVIYEDCSSCTAGKIPVGCQCENGYIIPIYYLKYNSDGGSNIPGTIERLCKSEALAISCQIPVWSGRTFLGWMDADADELYQPGDTYIAYGYSSLYAVWSSLLGDLNTDDQVTDDDAVYLLYNTFFPEDYPVSQNCDFNSDGEVNDNDAVYLLYNTFFPEDYPIS